MAALQLSIFLGSDNASQTSETSKLFDDLQYIFPLSLQPYIKKELYITQGLTTQESVEIFSSSVGLLGELWCFRSQILGGGGDVGSTAQGK